MVLYTVNRSQKDRECRKWFGVWKTGSKLQNARSVYGTNVFMQKQLPPAFSNSEVSTITGLSPSW